jgi:hypothetical protein
MLEKLRLTWYNFKSENTCDSIFSTFEPRQNLFSYVTILYENLGTTLVLLLSKMNDLHSSTYIYIYIYNIILCKYNIIFHDYHYPSNPLKLIKIFLYSMIIIYHVHINRPCIIFG